MKLFRTLGEILGYPRRVPRLTHRRGNSVQKIIRTRDPLRTAVGRVRRSAQKSRRSQGPIDLTMRTFSWGLQMDVWRRVWQPPDRGKRRKNFFTSVCPWQTNELALVKSSILTSRLPLLRPLVLPSLCPCRLSSAFLESFVSTEPDLGTSSQRPVDDMTSYGTPPTIPDSLQIYKCVPNPCFARDQQ